MDFDEQLRILRSAQGDPARLALASVDLLLAARPETERENVREALQAAAVVHFSIAYNKLGRVLRLKGDFAAALESYHANLAIAVPLAEQNPNNNRLQSHLAVSHNDIGDVLRDQGQLPETLEQYRAALAIR
jgi:tetratricopeptide (TPR) repeat protein